MILKFLKILKFCVVTVCACEGRLERTAVLKAICSGFNETSDPPICLNTGLETNECLQHNGGCWQDKRANMTACKVCCRPSITSHMYQLDLKCFFSKSYNVLSFILNRTLLEEESASVPL